MMIIELDLELEKRGCARRGCPKTFLAKKGSRRRFCDDCIIERISLGRAPKQATESGENSLLTRIRKLLLK